MLTEHLEILKRLGAATVHEAQGKTGALSSGIKPIDSAMTVSGTAMPVRTRPGDNLAMHRALLETQPGDVLVIDAFGCTEAGAWGDILSATALQRGVRGLVISGAVRDVDSIIEMDFPVFAKGVSIKGTTKVDPGLIGETIGIDGVDIARGDAVVGDRDGVVVVPGAQVAPVADAAQRREKTEQEYLEHIARGALTVDLLALR